MLIRLETLTIYSHKHARCSLCLDIGSFPLSLLQLDLDNADLFIGTPALGRSHDDPSASDGMRPQAALLGRLRHVHLRSCSAPLWPLLSPSLLSLQMSNTQLDIITVGSQTGGGDAKSPRGAHSGQCPHVIIQMVTACPRLEVLHLEQVFSSTGGALTANSEDELKLLVGTLATSLKALWLDLGSSVSAAGIRSLAGLRNLLDLGLSLSRSNG